MERTKYTQDKKETIRHKVLEMITIVSELEKEFPGRHFTLDGHLVGSIGEVMAAYYYGIELYDASTKTHDGEIAGRKVQIKITQRNGIVINADEKPDYLLVLYLTREGKVYEIYNGSGDSPWYYRGKKDSHNNYHFGIAKLMRLDSEVPPEDRIVALHPIEKMEKEYKGR